MQKKQILLGLTCVLAIGAIAGVTLAIGLAKLTIIFTPNLRFC